jgi:lauroyl/myristoyl acyltransferase
VIRGVTRAHLATLFPHLSRTEQNRALFRIVADRVRNFAFIRALHYLGIAPARRIVIPSETLAAIEPPVIFGSFHVGPAHALGAAVECLNGEVLVLRRRAYEPAQAKNIRVAETDGGDEQRARAFHQAAVHLRNRGYVLLPIDPMVASRVAAPFFGRSLLLARGAFALSRIEHVPIVPLLTRWRGLRVEVLCGPRIGPSDSEEELAASTAKWLESYLAGAPGEVTMRVFQLLRE